MSQADPSRRAIIHRASGTAGERLGPYVIESLLTEQEEGKATVYRVRVEPHCRTNVSYHKIAEEIYYVLSGHGTALLDGRDYTLQPGDLLRLPPGTTHGFVTGAEPLEMLDIHTPGCRPNRDVYFVDAVPDGFEVR
jgi:quercetin dioxygenase-like cupin family protein